MVRQLGAVLVEIQDLISLLSRHLLQILVGVSVYHVLEVRGICREVAELLFVCVNLIFELFFKPGVLEGLSLLEKGVIVVVLTALSVRELLVVSESVGHFDVGWINNAFAVVHGLVLSLWKVRLVRCWLQFLLIYLLDLQKTFH